MKAKSQRQNPYPPHDFPMQQPPVSTKQKIMVDRVIDFITSSSTKPKPQSRPQDEGEDRSGSILGRKLSFCDAQLTVSQNTLEALEKAAASHRDRETIQQRLSAIGFNLDSLASLQQQSTKPQRRSPLKESRISMVQQAASNNKPAKATSFMLTFNRDKSPSDQVKSVKPSTHKNKENKTNEKVKKPIDIKKILKAQLLPQETRMKQMPSKVSQRSPPKKRPQTSMLPQRKSESPNSFKSSPQRPQHHGVSMQMNRRSKDQNLRENLQKHGQLAKKEIEKLVYQEVEKRMKQQQLKVKNKQIRERNQLHQISVMHQQQQQQQQKNPKDKSPMRGGNSKHNKTIDEASAMKMKSKSPMRRFDEFRNRDMPLKVNEEEKKPKKKYDLGLEIFELKKEMGLFGEDKQSISIDKILTERSKKKQVQKTQKEQKLKMEIAQQLFSKKNYQENPSLQKLIAKQQKKRVKEQKKQKIAQIIDQQRVLSNLKILNEITEQRRIMKRHCKGQQFKTVVQEEPIIVDRSTILQKDKGLLKEYRGERSLSQQQQRRKSHMPKGVQESLKTQSPERPKKNLKIKMIQNNQQKGNMPTSSRRSLEHKAQQRISIRVPKTKILYSSVAQQQNVHNKSLGQDHQNYINQKHQQSVKQRDSKQENKPSLQKQKLIQKILRQLEKQQQSVRQKSGSQGRKSARSKSFTRKSSSKGHGNIGRRNHIISIDSASKHSKSFLQPRHDESHMIETSPQRNYRDSPNRSQYAHIDQAQPSDGAVNISVQSENVLIDDEMMIFCVLTTAASIIQRNFRNYLRRKKQAQQRLNDITHLHQPPSMLMSDELSSSQTYEQPPQLLSESTKLENRLLPVSEKREEPSRRKTPKHTFSFGNYDEQQMQFQQQQQQQPTVTQPTKPQNQFIQESTSFRLDSDPVDDAQPLFFNQMINQQNAPKPLQRNLEEDFKSLGERQSSQESSQDFDKILGINDKFKYALRSLAEKQKKTDILQKLKFKSSKEHQHDKQPSNQSSQRKPGQHYIPEKPPSSRLSDRKQNHPLHQQDDYSLKALQDEIMSFAEEKSARRSPFGDIKISSKFRHEVQEEEDKIIVQRYEQDAQTKNIDSSLSSLLASKGEQTDKIIFYSPKNTNEELIEAAVNESNNLGHNESSLMINESNIQSNKVDSSSQQKMSSSGMGKDEESKEEIKIDTFVNQPIFDYKFQPDPGYKSNREQILPQREKLRNFEESKSDEKSSHVLSQQLFNDEDHYDLNEIQHLYQQESSQKDSKRPILRMMFGDEKFLLDHDYDLRQFSQEGSPHGGSAPSTHRFIENPYFLATNASIFERNPFKEFTTNKLNDILQGKNELELHQIKEEALRYQEKLEKGFINRLEKREELSPRSSQRRKYELERWVSAEREKVQKPSLEDSKPINLFDLEQERQEAAAIIEQVNSKAREIKQQLQQNKKQTNSNVIHIQDQQQPFPGKEDEEMSSSKLDLSVEVQKEDAKAFAQGLSRMPDLSIGNEVSQNSINNKQEEMPTVVLEISFEDEVEINEDEEDFEELTFLKNQNQLIENQVLSHREDQKSQRDNSNSLEKELQKLNEMRKQAEQLIREDSIEKQKKADELTSLIFQEFLAQETQTLLDQASRIISKSKLPEVQQTVQDHAPVKEEEKEPVKPQEKKLIDAQEEHKQIMAQFSNERYDQLIKPQPVLEANVKELTYSSKEQQKRLGIETSEESIEQYIDEIFSQITGRRDQFLQAFITPIYKNPLEILSNLQRPDYGDIENSMDLTNSMAYILNVQLYLTLEKARENIIHETIQQIKRQNLLSSNSQLQSISNEDEFTDMMSEAQHIHNKVVFDCVNEALNMVRPYGSAGEPMPWSKKPRRNLMFMLDCTENLDEILNTVKNRVITWAKTKAGALPPRFGLTFENQNAYQQQMEEEHFAHQREKCLAQLLAHDLVQQEEKWLDYEMEEAQVKIDLSDIILEHLVGETVEVLNRIKARDFNQH